MYFSSANFQESPQDCSPENNNCMETVINSHHHRYIFNYLVLVEENVWTLYKYDFTRLPRNESLLDGFIVIEPEVSNEEQLVTLLQQHQIVDNPAGQCNYCFFRRSITPVWEDPLNIHGGRFVITFNFPLEITPDMLHGYWKALLRLILRQVRHTPYITGVKVHWWLPKYHTISVWTSKIFAHQELMEMKQNLNVVIPNCSIVHGAHNSFLKTAQNFISNFNS